MKDLIYLFFAVIIIFAGLKSCKPVDEPETQATLLTRAPSNTIWEYVTGGEMNQYILVTPDETKLFRGCVEDGELQRWSEFWDVEGVEFIGDYLMYNGNRYSYYGDKVYEIDGQWMTITVSIKPFSE